MKNILAIILSFLAGCLVVITVYNYKETIIIKENTVISETNTISPSIDNMYDSVLTVLGYTNSDSISTVGSSFVYRIDDEYAYILTNYHVIKGLNKIEVMDINENVVEAAILGYDEYMDVAVLRADKSIALDVVVLSDSSSIELGDTVFTVGTPWSEEYYGSVTKGIISYKNRLIPISVGEERILIDAIQTSTTINPGNSGGPLVNLNGEVIGIVTSKIINNEIEGLGFAIPINNVKPIIEALENGQAVSRLKSNLEVINLNDNYELYKNELYLEQDYEYGVYVKTIYNDSVFKDILKEKDIILKINDINVKNNEHFEYLINKNYNIILKIEREKEMIEIDFKK